MNHRGSVNSSCTLCVGTSPFVRTRAAHFLTHWWLLPQFKAVVSIIRSVKLPTWWLSRLAGPIGVWHALPPWEGFGSNGSDLPGLSDDEWGSTTPSPRRLAGPQSLPCGVDHRLDARPERHEKLGQASKERLQIGVEIISGAGR